MKVTIFNIQSNTFEHILLEFSSTFLVPVSCKRRRGDHVVQQESQQGVKSENYFLPQVGSEISLTCQFKQGIYQYCYLYYYC